MALGLFVVFSGCTTSTSGNSKQDGFSLSSFNGGNLGLVESFQSMTPSKVRDQGTQPFSIGLIVTNKGEANVLAGTAHLSLTGFDPTTFGLKNSSKALYYLKGVKKIGSNVISGGRELITFSNLLYNSSVVSGSIPIKIYANLCYPYKTIVVALICVKPNTVSSVNKKAEICSISGVKPLSNSGAPVQISDFQEYPYGKNSVQFQFNIIKSPKSLGTVYQTGSLDNNCNIDGNSPASSEALFKQDKISYFVNTSIPGLNCEQTGGNNNTITLSSGSYTVTCIQNTKGQQSYVKPISIVLKYDYLNRISKIINIEHIG